jgi:hypothetical protein
LFPSSSFSSPLLSLLRCQFTFPISILHSTYQKRVVNICMVYGNVTRPRLATYTTPKALLLWQLIELFPGQQWLISTLK